MAKLDKTAVQTILDHRQMDIAGQLYYEIEMRGLDKGEIASAMGWSRRKLDRMLTGFSKTFTPKMVAQFEVILGCSILTTPLRFRKIGSNP